MLQKQMHTPEQQASIKLLELLEITKRNIAIAEMLKFKRYVPSAEVLAAHSEQYKHFLSDVPLRWYYIPNVGRYNCFELKFDRDYNWLVSALIEMKQYEASHLLYVGSNKLANIFFEIRDTKPFDFNLKRMWTLVADYAIELLQQKELEKQKRNKNQG